MAIKTDGGKTYTTNDYLYTPDPVKPSTWKIRISDYEGDFKESTVAQLDKATDEFFEIKTKISGGEASKIKVKLRALYRKLGVPDEQVPDSIKASLRRVTPNIVEDTIGEAFSESSIAKEGDGNVIENVCLFGSRYSKNGRTYSDKAIESIGKFSEGARVFIDHLSDREDADSGGVRSLRSFLGALYNVERRGEKVYAGQFKIHPDHINWVKGLVEHFPDKAGFSICASGKLVKTKEGNVVEDISKIHSVDLVSSPATTTSFFEDINDLPNSDEEKTHMADTITLDVLRSEYPHLVSAILAESEQQKKVEKMGGEIQSMKETVEAKDSEIKKLNDTVTGKDSVIVEKEKVIADKDKEIEDKGKELQTVKVKLEGYEMRDQMAEKKALIDKVIKDSEIPAEAITPRIREILDDLKSKTVKDGESEKEVTVEDQAKAILEDFKGILGKAPVVRNTSTQDDNTSEKKYSPEKFAEILKRSQGGM